MGKALNDSDLFTSADVLDEEVKKVKEEITQVQSACSDNLSTLCIMQKLCEEGKDGEVFLEYLKSSAEALRKDCGEKLQSLKSEWRKTFSGWRY